MVVRFGYRGFIVLRFVSLAGKLVIAKTTRPPYLESVAPGEIEFDPEEFVAAVEALVRTIKQGGD